MAISYNRYRVRKGWFGQCVLQQLVSFPSFAGGIVDSSIPEFEWIDVPYKCAVSEFEVQPYSGGFKPVRSNEKPSPADESALINP